MFSSVISPKFEKVGAEEMKELGGVEMVVRSRYKFVEEVVPNCIYNLGVSKDKFFEELEKLEKLEKLEAGGRKMNLECSDRYYVYQYVMIVKDKSKYGYLEEVIEEGFDNYSGEYLRVIKCIPCDITDFNSYINYHLVVKVVSFSVEGGGGGVKKGRWVYEIIIPREYHDIFSYKREVGSECVEVDKFVDGSLMAKKYNVDYPEKTRFIIKFEEEVGVEKMEV